MKLSKPCADTSPSSDATRSRVKGTMLLYAVGFVAVMGMFCATLTHIGHRSAMVRARVNAIYLAHLNMESAWTLGLNNVDPSTLGSHLELTHGAKVESTTQNWGLYQLVSITSSVSGYTVTHSGIIGHLVTDPLPVLTVPANNDGVKFGGAASVKGKVRIPDGKWDRLHTGTNTGKLDLQVEASTTDSPLTLLKKRVRNTQLQIPVAQTLHLSELEDSLNCSFSDSTIYLLCNTHAYLKNISLHGNLVLVGSEIYIDQSCDLQNISIVCEKLTIGEAFTGSIHAHCSKEIIVEKGSQLTFPSSLLLNIEQENSAHQILLDETSEVQGTLALLHQHQGKPAGVIRISPGARVIGEVFTDGTVEIQGHISGAVVTNKLKANTKGRSYAQAMVEGTLDNKLPSPFGISAENGKRKTVLKWLD